MVILHICPLSGDRCSGVGVAVPQHVAAQQRIADAALWNLEEPIEQPGLRQFTADSLDALPAPYRRPDLAVFHEVYIPRYLSLAKELRKQGIPYIIVPHGCLRRRAQQKSRLKKAAANLLLFRPFCNHALGIQCLTDAEKRESVMGYQLFVAPNGVDPQPQTKHTFHADSIRFVYVGRMLPHIKGLDLMIDAFAKQKALVAAQNCSLALYGPADDRGVSHAEELRERIAQRGMESAITLNPPVFGAEKQRVLLDADVFIQTSRTEGMPLGVLEALSYGLPCLLTEGTSFAGIVSGKSAGWNAGSTADSIAAALAQAVSDRGRLTQFSANALALSQAYSWDAAARRAIDAYRALLSNGSRHRAP